MFSKSTEPRSIASQLVLLFAPAAALLLLCGLLVLYWMVVRHAFEEDNAVLADKLAAVAADFRAAPRPGGWEMPRNGERTTYWIRVLNAGHRAVMETSGMEALLPATLFPEPPSAIQKQRRVGDKWFGLAATTIEMAGERHTIQVAQDRSEDAQFAKEFGVLVVAVLVVGVAASILIAVTVTRRGLRPLAAMTQSLQRTTPRHLDERVEPAAWPRELQPVAIAFDEMLDRLEDSFTRLSQFSADLAHELRTPIANIRGETEVALTRPRSPNEYREVLESNVAECERLSATIDKLLFLARAEAANEQVERVGFQGRAEVEKIASYYESIAEERGVAIVCEGEGTLFADRVLFGRALANLLDNALRFTPAGGKIVIRMAERPNECEVAVQDTGSGIPAEHLPRIFDRFYRSDSSRSSEGTGLGLALVKSIMDLHGGTVSAQSVPAAGTTITLIFPPPPNITPP